MTTETKYTPTPWKIESTRNLSSWCIVSGKRVVASCSFRAISREEARANAAFIVRACNAHEELVAALEVALHHVAARDRDSGCKAWREDHKQIEAALAKARGEA